MGRSPSTVSRELRRNADRLGRYRGAVHVLYGSRTGLTSRGDQVWRQSSRGVSGVTEADDQFGLRVAVADFGRNGSGPALADVVVASSAESVRGVRMAGSAHVLYGAAVGVGALGGQVWTEDRLGGVLTEHSDSIDGGFGTVLAAR